MEKVIDKESEKKIIAKSRAEQSRAEQSRAEQLKCRIIGQMDNTQDHTFESANRVYSSDGVAPTIPTCSGGNIQPKVLVRIRT